MFVIGSGTELTHGVICRMQIVDRTLEGLYSKMSVVLLSDRLDRSVVLRVRSSILAGMYVLGLVDCRIWQHFLPWELVLWKRLLGFDDVEVHVPYVGVFAVP